MFQTLTPETPVFIVSIQSLRDSGKTLYFGLDRDGFEDVVERFEIHRDLRDPSRTSSIVRGSHVQKSELFLIA
jgi:hypothetical protein